MKVICVSFVNDTANTKNYTLLYTLEQHVAEKKTVVGFTEAEPLTNEQLLVLPCDILVPAAMERQITAANAAKIQCRILAEAANGPTTPEADAILTQRPEIFVLPDVLCNAGGVVVSYFEWVQDLQLLLGRDRSDGQALPHPRKRLHPNRHPRPKPAQRLAASASASNASGSQVITGCFHNVLLERFSVLAQVLLKNVRTLPMGRVGNTMETAVRFCWPDAGHSF